MVCGEVDILLMGVIFSHSLLILDISTDGMLSRQHDTTSRDIYGRLYMFVLIHAMCTEAEHTLSLYFTLSCHFFPLMSYTLSGVKGALFCVNFLKLCTMDVSLSTYKYRLAYTQRLAVRSFGFFRLIRPDPFLIDHSPRSPSACTMDLKKLDLYLDSFTADIGS